MGLLDEAALYDDPGYVFPLMQQARTQVLRVNLYWGGRVGVARSRPARATDPSDPAYDWSLYDRTVNYAAQHKIRVLFSIFGTPGWANGGKGLNVPPAKIADLNNFAYAAAKRYNGVFPGADGRTLPPVKLWLAWNEPNLSIGLKQQFKRVGGRWVIQSAIDYAKICTAVYSGVHRTLIKGEKVACGATAPRGNNEPTSARPTVSPLAFMRALKKAGLRKFDAYAHHPYYGRKTEAPNSKPASTAITMGNINVLIAELTRLWGHEAALDHRVRLPDESARPRLRRLLQAAGGVHEAGLRDGPQEPAHRHDALVPPARRAGPRRLAVGSPHADGGEEALVQRVPLAAPRLSPIPASSALSDAAPTTSVTIVLSPDQTSARSIGITEIQ